VTDESARFIPTMKLSADKINYPGRKQVFRLEDKKGRFIKDIIGLDKEGIKGRPLLKKVVDKGRVIYKTPLLSKIRRFLKRSLSKFPRELKEVRPRYKYPVIISPQLVRLKSKLSQQLQKRQ
jgi:nicotinate phosphoribosyltransferase